MHKRAIIAVAHTLVYAIYDVLANQRAFQPAVIEPLDQKKTERLIRHHTRRLRKLKLWLPKAGVRDETNKTG